VCQECLDSIQPIRVPQCVQCGERLLPAQLLMGDGHCQGCRDFEPEFDRAVSFDPQRVKGRTVIVVDDVMTTGTTVSECARVLKKAGAERVWAVTVARTLKFAVLPESVEYGEEEAHEAVEAAVSV